MRNVLCGIVSDAQSIMFCMIRIVCLWMMFLGVRVSFAQTTHHYENLVFEGAGMRGIAYCGVIDALEKKGMMADIKRVGGTSAGAITALMLSLGYTSSEMYEIISETKFQQFNDGSFFFIGGISRMNNRFGWYRGNSFNRWLEQIIEHKTGDKDITFSELQDRGFKQLYVTGTCLNKQKLVVFSAATYPCMKIKDAVRVSMSVPLYFEAVFMDSAGNIYQNKHAAKDLDVMVDGGIIGNYPVFIFDSVAYDVSGQKIRIPNPHTLGVRIDTDEQIASDTATHGLVTLRIRTLADYFQAFYVLSLESLNRNTLIPQDWERTISVSSAGVGARVRRLSKKEKESLVKSGERHTLKYMSRG